MEKLQQCYAKRMIKRREKFASDCDVPGQNNLLVLENHTGYSDREDDEENESEGVYNYTLSSFKCYLS